MLARRLWRASSARWTPIGAEQTASGYEVAWKVAGADQYTVWNTDSSGNYSRTSPVAVSGTSRALESLETSFHQDLNGDGVIGQTTIATGTTTEIPSAFAGTITFAGSTGTLQLDSSSSFSGTVAQFTGLDSLDLKGINPATVQSRTYSWQQHWRHSYGRRRYPHRQRRLARELSRFHLRSLQ